MEPDYDECLPGLEGVAENDDTERRRVPTDSEVIHRGAKAGSGASRRSVWPTLLTEGENSRKAVKNGASAETGPQAASHAPLERLLGPTEVSELLGVPVATLYRWSYRRRAGYDDGPECLKVGTHLRYRPQAIRDYLRRVAS